MTGKFSVCPECNGTGKIKHRLGSMDGRNKRGQRILQVPGPGLLMACPKCEGTGQVPSASGGVVPPGKG